MPWPQLSTISLAQLGQITDASVVSLAKRLPSLRSVDVSRCIELTDTSVNSLLRSCRELNTLNLNSLDKVTDTTLASLCKFVSLCAVSQPHDYDWCGFGAVTRGAD